MNNQPLVSILINNYNYGRFLKDAIESALNQSYQPIEVIVVDDGSIDDSREIICSYGDRIKTILKENGGQASAFNQGFANSRGDIICFLDSDDLFKSSKAEEIVQDFQQDQSIGWHFHNLELFGDHIEVNTQETATIQSNLSGIYDLSPNVRNGKLNGTLPFELSIATSGMSFNRSLLAKILPMDEKIRITSDDYIKYAAFGLTKGFISSQLLAKQRIHGNNAYTGKLGINQLRGIIHILTASNLRRQFPELSKFSNNLAATSVSIYWWVEGNKAELGNDINEYLKQTPFPEKLVIYSKAIYYRYIRDHLTRFRLKR